MFRYTFTNGETITSTLSKEKLVAYILRLDTLRVLVEGYDEGSTGEKIRKKAVKAFNKVENFTGRIRLTSIEKDFLLTKLENDMITEEEKEVIKYYCK